MEKQINKWLEKSLITKEKAMELLADYKEEVQQKRKVRSQVAFYTIGTILIGLGVISFIAANDWIIQLFLKFEFGKILAMILATIGSFYGGYHLVYENKKYPRLGNTLIFLSTLLIGGTYALIGQIYHLNADNSGLMFLWLASVVPLAYIFKNKAINILSVILFILGIIFYYAELSFDNGYTWTIFIPVILGSFLYCLGNVPYIQKNYNDFSLAYKLTGLVPIFITLLILTCSIENSYQLVSINYFLPIIALMVFNGLNFYFEQNKTKLFKIETGFIFALLVLLSLILAANVISIPLALILIHTLIILIITACFSFGYDFENIRIIDLGTTFLMLYVIAVYCRWGWSFFDKTLFFILGGSLLLGLGFYLEKKKKAIIKKNEGDV